MLRTELIAWIGPVTGDPVAATVAVAVAAALVAAAVGFAIRRHARADRPDLVIRELLLTGEVRIGPNVFHNCQLIGVANRGRGPAIRLHIRLGVDDCPMNAGHPLSDSLAPGRDIPQSTASFSSGLTRPQVYRIELACDDVRGRRHVTHFAYHPPSRPGDFPAAARWSSRTAVTA
jgi:hypothetical protein